ncbi:MAG: ABC transporter permease [Thermoleophilia bacterium]
MTARRIALRTFNVVALPAALLAVWWWASAGSTSPFFPPLSRILDASSEVWTVETLREAVAPSLARLAAGVAVASVAGIALGVLIGRRRRVDHALAPVLEFFRAVPPPVLVPALIVLIGIGDSMRVTLIALGCLWPVLLNTADGVRSIDAVALDTARSLRLTALGNLRHVILPAASPRIAAGMYQALGIGVVLMVISEMFAASTGIGATVVRFQQSFATTKMWSGVLMLGLIGILLSVAFRAVERRLLHWYEASRAAERSR